MKEIKKDVEKVDLEITDQADWNEVYAVRNDVISKIMEVYKLFVQTCASKENNDVCDPEIDQNDFNKVMESISNLLSRVEQLSVAHVTVDPITNQVSSFKNHIDESLTDGWFSYHYLLSSYYEIFLDRNSILEREILPLIKKVKGMSEEESSLFLSNLEQFNSILAEQVNIYKSSLGTSI